MPAPIHDRHTAPQPLETIGLAISGGGFRAASFSLGCLAYLHHCTIDTEQGAVETLLSRVRFIASASGGSFTNLLYATYLYTEQPFNTFYNALRNFMKGDELLAQVFATLESDAAWEATPDKQRNLINAFSLAYQQLFDRALPPGSPHKHVTLGLFGNPDHLPPLRQFCANATEFRNGLTFRFQNPDQDSRLGWVGNFSLYLDPRQPAVANKLRLGDIMAASSCFPSGLEPIMFPNDFAYTGDTPTGGLTQAELSGALICRNAVQQARQLRDNVTEAQNQLAPQEQLDLTIETRLTPVASPQPEADTIVFGLMDGGIDDNQGLGSLLLADARHRKETGHGYGTLIACDVNSPYMSQYALPQTKTGFLWNRSLRFWSIAAGILFALLAGIGYRWGTTAGTVLTTLGIAGLLLDVGLNVGLYRLLKNLSDDGTWGWAATRYVGYFFTIPVGSLLQMISARLRSTVILAADVYMKQIRRMHYQLFYENKKLDNRRVACLLHTLAETFYATPAGNTRKATSTSTCVARYDLHPSPVMRQIAADAQAMETTLWFDTAEVNGERRDKLIATGQFTLCYSLLLYLCSLEQKQPLSPALQALQRRMLTDWQAFQQDPMWLVKRVM